jgi:hypothetical protein
MKRRKFFKRIASLPKQVLWFGTWLLPLPGKGMSSFGAVFTGAAVAAVCGGLLPGAREPFFIEENGSFYSLNHSPDHPPAEAGPLLFLLPSDRRGNS